MGQHGKHRALVRRGFSLLGAAVLAAAPVPALACRLALLLALDVSGSVDEGEYALQLSGVAEALGDPDVQNAIFAIPDLPVAISVYEWSSASYQGLIVDWTELRGQEDLAKVRGALKNWRRAPGPQAISMQAQGANSSS